MDDTTEALIQKFFAFLRDTWAWLCKTSGEFAETTSKAGIEADFGVTVFLALLVLILLGSACWAASVAACRRHNALPHFVLGFLFPWIYPLVLVFLLDVKGAKQMRKNLEKARLAQEAEKEEREKNIALNSGIEQSGQEEVVDGSPYSMSYFEKIARNEDGSNAGPWHVVFNSNAITVTKILEPMPELVYVEFLGERDSVQKMRIPYTRIESWEKIQ